MLDNNTLSKVLLEPSSLPLEMPLHDKAEQEGLNKALPAGGGEWISLRAKDHDILWIDFCFVKKMSQVYNTFDVRYPQTSINTKV